MQPKRLKTYKRHIESVEKDTDPRSLVSIKERIVRLTRRMRQKRLDLLIGCQKLSPLCKHFDALSNEELVTFIVVDEELTKVASEAGLSQEYMNWIARPEVASKISQLRELYEPHIREACEIAYDFFLNSELLAQFNLIDIANDMLSGKCEFWSGCRSIGGVSSSLGPIGGKDPLFLGFVGIDSELDSYPVWKERCDPVYWAEKQKNLARYREAIQEGVYEDCREIIRRFDY